MEMIEEPTLTLEKSVEEIIAIGSNYDMHNVLVRHCEDYSVSMEEALEHSVELKKFLVLTALYPNEVFGMVNPVDDLWHSFIIHTRAYMKFCHDIAGKYIHHDINPEPSSFSIEEYANVLDKYQKHFGNAPEHIWPTVERAEVENLLGCRSIASCKAGGD